MSETSGVSELAAEPRGHASYSASRTPELISVTARPNLAKIMSISGITVALVAAAAMGAERFLSPAALTFQVSDTGIAEPIYGDTGLSDAILLGRRIELLERQIVLLQSQVRDAQTDATSFLQRVGSLEERVSGVEADPDGKQIVDRIDREDAATEAVAAVELPQEELITGSINPQEPVEEDSAGDDQTAAIAPSPDVGPSGGYFITQTQFALSLDLHDNIADLTESWNGLRQRFGSMLEGMQARALHQGTESGDIRYRLLIGPIENAAAAAEHCARMQTQGVRCSQTVFGGELIEGPPSPGTLIRLDVIGDASDEPPLSASVARMIESPPIPTAKPDRAADTAQAAAPLETQPQQVEPAPASNGGLIPSTTVLDTSTL
jgi:hypothetical protein